MQPNEPSGRQRWSARWRRGTKGGRGHAPMRFSPACDRPAGSRARTSWPLSRPYCAVRSHKRFPGCGRGPAHRTTGKRNEFPCNWLNNTLLLGVPDHICLADPNTYRLNENVTVMSQEGTDSWWCEKAIFKVRRPVDIKDSQAVEEMAEELLKL